MKTLEILDTIFHVMLFAEVIFEKRKVRRMEMLILIVKHFNNSGLRFFPGKDELKVTVYSLIAWIYKAE